MLNSRPSHLILAAESVPIRCTLRLFCLLLVTFAPLTLPAQNFPARGFLPGNTFDLSDTEDINLVSGNMIFQVPLFKFPAGPAGQSMEIGLVYNSFIYDQAASGANPQLIKSTTGGGWGYSFQYSMALDTSGATTCSSTVGMVRLSILFPDGSRHLLHLKGSTTDPLGTSHPSDGNGFYYNYPSGKGTCGAKDITGTLVYYTDDGTFVRVEVNTAADTWTAFFPDGMRVSGHGTGLSIPSDSDSITDRNGNSISIVVSQTCVTPCSPEPQFTITDQLGRQLTLSSILDPNGNPVDTMHAPGYKTQLSWTIDWATFKSTDQTYTYGGYPQNSPGGIFVKDIALPSVNGEKLKYQFDYAVNPGWGQLKNVTTPYGLSASYEYADAPDLNDTTWPKVLGILKKTHTWNDPQNTQRTQTWSYSIPVAYTNTVAVAAPDGGTTTHTFCTDNYFNQSFCSTKLPNGDVIDRVWKKNCPFQIWTGQPGNAYVKTEFHTFKTSSGDKAAIKDYSYDRNGNFLSVTEYDLVDAASIRSGSVLTIPSGATALRTTANAYYITTGAVLGDACGDSGINNIDDPYAYWNTPTVISSSLRVGSVLNARTSTTLSDNLGNRSQWTYTYGSNNGHATTDANITSEQNGSTTISHAYDSSGNLKSTTDGNNVVTAYTVDSCPDSAKTHYGYASAITRDKGGSLERTTSQTWDCDTGLLTSTTDPNKVLTNFDYDAIGRRTLIDEAFGTDSERQTNISYAENTSPLPLTITTRRDLYSAGESSPNHSGGPGGVVEIQQYDQRGLIAAAQNSDITVQTFGRLAINVPADANNNVTADMASYSAVSNPYRSTADATMGWTRTKYDSTGRVVSVDHFDGATPPCPFGSAAPCKQPTSPSPCPTDAVSCSTAIYDGYLTTATDEALASRKYTADGLGRIASVGEDPSALNYSTSYKYDFGDRVTSVTQGSQSRTFTYDAFGRLITTKNPEIWDKNASQAALVTFTYDSNGNVTSKATPAGTINYSYDHLNRINLKTYPDNTQISYCYDGIASTVPTCSNSPTGALLIDRLTMVQNQNSTTQFSPYDELGEIMQSQQVTGGSSFLLTYGYNRLGGLTSITYPSGRQVSRAYDAAGRVASVANAATGAVYANNPLAPGMSIGYAPNGSVSDMTFGNGLRETTTFNTRFQPTSIQAGSLLTLGYSYATAQNNGNIQTHTIADGTTTRTQRYTYDGVNRLKTAAEDGAWSQAHVYDPYGNRALLSSSNDPSVGLDQLLDPLTADTTVPFNPANNQWNGSGVSYDSSGNLSDVVVNPNSFHATYDVENHLIKTTTTIVGTTTTTTTINYTYDGDGRRVTKAVAGGATTTYVYDAQGNLAAESSTGSNPDAGTTQYLTADHLGSTRLTTKTVLVNSQPTPGVLSRSDYLPFGQEIPATWGGRTNYVPDPSQTVKFTGKERDAETGLDYFEARYLSSAQGRFTSTDPVIMGLHKVTNPQNLNLYAYARGNPLRFTDPTGEIIEEDIEQKYRKRYEEWKAEFLKTKAGQALWNKYQNDKNFTLTIKFGANAGGQQGAETGSYHWDASGQLDAATITLGAKLSSGYPSGENYPVTSSLRPDSGGTELSADTIAATKLAHEFGHVEFTAATPEGLFKTQNALMGVWNSRFLETGVASWPLLEINMGGTPVQISTTRERGAEGSGAVPYLRDRFPGKPGENMLKRIQQAIQNYEKGK